MPDLYAGIPIRTSLLVPEGQVLIIDEGRILGALLSLESAEPAQPTVLVNPASRDRYGTPAPVVRTLIPSRGYTRHTLGTREVERELRLRRRGR